MKKTLILKICCFLFIVLGCVVFSVYEQYENTAAGLFMKKNIVEEERMQLKDYQKINDDVYYLLCFSDREIPVVKSLDNIDYVRKNIWQKKDSMGAAMIDYQVSENSQNLIIHGHSSISNDYMFTPFKDAEYLQENQQFRLIGSNGMEEYQLLAYLYLDTENPADYHFLQADWSDLVEFRNYLYQQNADSLISFNVEIPGGESLLTLVTCDATDSRYRHVVMAVPFEEEGL